MVVSLAHPAAAQVAGTIPVATTGDLIHCEDSSAVYYIGEDGERYVFPNEQVYFSWNEGFEDVIEVECEDMAQLPLGGAVTYQAGAVLVKLQSDPSVYAVEDDGVLRELMSEEQAEALYGDDWADQVDDLPDGFWTHYEVGEPLGEGEIPDGMIAVDDDGNVYRAHDGVFVEMDELVSEQEDESLSELGEDLEEVEDRVRVTYEIEIDSMMFDEATITQLLTDLMHMLVPVDVDSDLEVEIEIEGLEIEIEVEVEDESEDASDDSDEMDEDDDGLLDEWEAEWEMEEESEDADDDDSDDATDDANEGSDDADEAETDDSGEDSADDTEDTSGSDDSSDDTEDTPDDTADDSSDDNSGDSSDDSSDDSSGDSSDD